MPDPEKHHLKLNHKKELKYGEKAIIETKFVNTPAAKLIFEYEIYKINQDQKEVVATGSTTQIFLDQNRVLMLTVPPFLNEWKLKNGLL